MGGGGIAKAEGPPRRVKVRRKSEEKAKRGRGEWGERGGGGGGGGRGGRGGGLAAARVWGGSLTTEYDGWEAGRTDGLHVGIARSIVRRGTPQRGQVGHGRRQGDETDEGPAEN